jgi:hypothetical protein
MRLYAESGRIGGQLNSLAMGRASQVVRRTTALRGGAQNRTQEIQRILPCYWFFFKNRSGT